MRINRNVQERFSQIEFWVITSVFTLGILAFGWQGIDTGKIHQPGIRELFKEQNLQFGFYKHYFLPHMIRYLTYFSCFMWLNFRVVPHLLAREKMARAWISMTLCFAAIWLVNTSSDHYIKAYLWKSMDSENHAFAYVWQSNLMYALWLVFAFVTYSLFKYGGLLVLSFFEEHPSKMPWLQVPQLQAWTLLVLVALVLLFFTPVENSVAWITVAASCILFYNLAFYRWIPIALTKKRYLLHYGWRVLLYASPISFLIALLTLGPSNNEAYSVASGMIHWFSLVFVASPGIWIWYQYQQKRKVNMEVLEQKLGQSTAQLDQLRAQINPHFLFNALNTVYGLALTEQAEKTADALEKISEMMRFMLRENQEASIPLDKDLDYLKNYISIQQMRLGPNPQIDLVVDMPEQVDPLVQIAPMLLIPFVENAFKHGISLQAASFIHLLLRIEDRQLYFSLHNSTHDRLWINDPEKHNHGIGLSNVKQRLALLYPERHLLDLREDDQSYKVTLTLLL